ncbi:MAG: LysM-like peptidoglycan-binding domain-containing protein, partial [Burkholderiales bacterium]
MNRIDAKKLALSLGAVCSLAAVTAFGVAPASDADLPEPQARIESVVLQAQVIEPTVALSQTERVRRGETLASLFGRLGLDDPEVNALVQRHALARQLLELRAGRVVSAQLTPDGKLQRLTYGWRDPASWNRGTRLVFERVAGHLMSFSVKVPLSRSIETRSAEIQT